MIPGVGDWSHLPERGGSSCHRGLIATESSVPRVQLAGPGARPHQARPCHGCHVVVPGRNLDPKQSG
jgi:hypothetical protein